MTRRTSAAPDPLMRPDAVAAYLGKSRSWVYEHKAALGAVWVGGELRFPPSAIAAYVARGAVTAPEQAVTDLATAREQRRPSLTHTSPVNPLDNLPWEASR